MAGLAPAAAIGLLATSWLVPWATLVELAAYPVAASGLGAASGYLGGLAAPSVLERLRKRLSLKAITALALLAGGLWGAAVGAAATLVVWPAPAFTPPFVIGALLGAPVGAMALGLLWLPYTMQAVLGGRRWPVLAAAAVMAPALGVTSWLCFQALV